jgi:hypothetical protein
MKRIKLSLLLFAITFGLFASNEVTINKPGSFFVGANYWASHAGTNMWSNWSESTVDKDFEQLSKAGVKVLRVFPIWSDFQPIYNYYTARNNVKEVRFKDSDLPGEGLGAMGVDSIMMSRFRKMADLAKKHDLKLVVGLVTGWMSGRLFVPPALEGKNPMTDPISLMWQMKFIKSFVNTMKDHSAILAWDLGNECNQMGNVETYQQAYLWTASISNAIKANDNTRLVISGMHGLSASNGALWRISDQGELTDILTTHPYPIFTAYANHDEATSIRAIMHSVSETRLYADVSKKTCIVEETGILGPMEAGELATSKFFRSIAFNLWANDCRGVMWWCAYDQGNLSHPPYDWDAYERDLGLFRVDRSPKKVADELVGFTNFIRKFPYPTLPVRKTDAVCILSEGSDQWANAYGANILAKQAELELEFQHAAQPLKDAKLYLLPCIGGSNVLSRHDWLNLLEKVKKGATLYISTEGGFLSPFLKEAGFVINTSQTRLGGTVIKHEGQEKFSYTFWSSRKYNISLDGATAIAKEEDGNPAFLVNNYGAGKIYFLTVPLESNLIKTPNSFSSESSPYWKIYKEIAEDIIASKLVQKNNPQLSCTEHYINEKEAVVVIVNNSDKDITTTLGLKKDWKYMKAFYGDEPRNENYSIKANDANVFLIKK